MAGGFFDPLEKLGLNLRNYDLPNQEFCQAAVKGRVQNGDTKEQGK